MEEVRGFFKKVSPNPERKAFGDFGYPSKIEASSSDKQKPSSKVMISNSNSLINGVSGHIR